MPDKFSARLHFPTELDAVSAMELLKLQQFKLSPLVQVQGEDEWESFAEIQLNESNSQDRVRNYLKIIVHGLGGDFVEHLPSE